MAPVSEQEQLWVMFCFFCSISYFFSVIHGYGMIWQFTRLKAVGDAKRARKVQGPSEQLVFRSATQQDAGNAGDIAEGL